MEKTMQNLNEVKDEKPNPNPKRLSDFERALRMFEENRKLGLDDKTILIEIEH